MQPAPLPKSTRPDLQALATIVTETAEAEGVSLKRLTGSHPRLPTPQTIRQYAQGNVPKDAAQAAEAAETFGAVVSEILDGSEPGQDELYDDLSTTRAGRNQFSRLLMSRTAAKLVIVEGFSGSGKTSLARVLMDRYNKGRAVPLIHLIEGTAGWSDRPNAMLAAMLGALGIADAGRSQAKRLDRLQDALQGQSVVWFIDEAHDFGVRCLRVLKTLLNTTGAKVVLACHPTLLKHLERDNWEDLSQLTQNRLLARIRLGGHREEDVAVLLKRKLPQLTLGKKEAEKFTARLSQAASQNGNLALVREVIVRLQRLAGQTAEPLTLQHAEKALTDELKARGRRLG